MDPAAVVLGGIVIAVVSGAIGKYTGGKNKVGESSCKERREACVTLLATKIDNLVHVVERVEKAVNNGR
jgi:hypothetical protein